jgi:hypothetical protein
MSDHPSTECSDTQPLCVIQRAVVRWLTGILFAVLLVLIVVFVGPHIPGLGPLLNDFELWGVDTAMRIHEATRESFMRVQSSPTEPGYVFLDIDPEYCQRTDPSFSDYCSGQSPALPSVMANAAAAILSAHPRVVIIDSRLWGYDDPIVLKSALERLTRNAHAAALTRIISVAPFYPTGFLGAQDWTLLSNELREAPIRFASAYLTFDRDGVERTYRAFANSPSPGRYGLSSAGLPTVPFLASLYLDAAQDSRKLSAIDCNFGPIVSPHPPVCDQRIPDSARKIVSQNIERAKIESTYSRMDFTLPSFAPRFTTDTYAQSEVERENREARFANFFDVFQASQAIDRNGKLHEAPADKLRNKIVIIGTSAESALDYHETPLGGMSGAEFVLNAVKAFHDNSFFSRPSEFERLELEGIIILVSSLPFLFFWIVYFWMLHPWRGSALAAIFRPLIVFILFVFCVGAAMIVAATLTICTGYKLSYLIPVFSLSLEGFADGARWAIALIDAFIERLIGWIVLRFERLLRTPS